MNEKPVSFILLISKGILRDRSMRRRALFWIVAGALFLLGAGVMLLDEWLSTHPVIFLLYWGACLWLTVSSMLLAFYDMLLIRQEAREERRKSRFMGNDT
jgi:hypothetical protein